MATPAAFQPLHKAGLVISYETDSDTRIPQRQQGSMGLSATETQFNGCGRCVTVPQEQCCALATSSGPPMGTGAEGRWQLGAGERGDSSRSMER